MGDPHASRPATDCHALVDQLLLEQGRVEPLELLLAADLLAYEDYEAWRLGQRRDLEGALQIAPEEAAELLNWAADYARGQRLASSVLEYRGWGAADQLLSIGSHAALAAACALAFAPPADRAQLDLFQDSSAALAEQAICCALSERRAETARQQVTHLMQKDPRHPRLGGYLRLIQAIDESADGERVERPEARLDDLEEVERLARQILGQRARDFVAPLWAAVATQFSGRPFDPACPQQHASHAWARASRWDAVRAAVEAESAWRDQPELVLRHAEACWRRRQGAVARRDWMWLCWEHPPAAERAFAAQSFPDRRLCDFWRRFGDLDQELATEDFPAWLLLAEPGAAAAVPADAAPADEVGAAYRLLQALVTGQDRIAQRQALSEIHPRLLQLYLARRAGRPER
jgi:hypothetical protein